MFRHLGSLTVRRKLSILGVLVSFLVLILVVSGWQGFLIIQQKQKIVHGLDLERAHLQTVLRGLAEVALTEKTPASRQITLEGIDNFETTQNELLAAVRSKKIRQTLVGTIGPTWGALRKDVDAFLERREISPANVEAMIAYGKLVGDSEVLLAQLTELARAERAYANTVVTRTIWLLVVLALVIICTSSLYLQFVYRSVVVPMARMVEHARKAARGDLTSIFHARHGDEIGVLAMAFGEMTENLRRVVQRVKEITGEITTVSRVGSDTSRQVAVSVSAQNHSVSQSTRSLESLDETLASMALSSQYLDSSSKTASDTVSDMTDAIGAVVRESRTFGSIQEKTASSVEQMIASVKDVGASISHLSVAAGETVGALQLVDESIGEVQQKASESVRLAEYVSHVATEKGVKAMAAAVEGIDEIRHTMGSLAETIHSLGKRSEEIGQVLIVIDEVTEQTELLSFNAAIIAAQSREHGRSFAVVAEEIKELAQRTSLSTREVNAMIRAIQAETRSSMEKSVEGMKVVEKGMLLVREANKTFESIHSSSLDTTDKSRDIEKTTAEQARRVAEVNMAIREMLDHIERIASLAGEQGVGAQSILDAVGETRTVFRGVLETIGRLSEGSERMRIVSQEVFQHANNILNGISDQKTRSTTVVDAMKSTRDTADSLTGKSAVMERAIATLEAKSRALEKELEHFTL